MLNHWKEFEPNYWEIRGQTGNMLNDTPPRRDSLTPNNYEAGELAVDFIYNLAKEFSYEGGLPYILYTQTQREMYRIAAYYILLFNENLGQVDETEIMDFASLGEHNALVEILQDSRFTSQLNEIFKDSKPIDSLPDWKSEDWFGIFMDKNYPWVLHYSLGWIYLDPCTNNQQGFWFYWSEREEWFWTGRNYYAKGYMFSNKLGKWVYYLEDSDALFIYSEQEWVKL